MDEKKKRPYYGLVTRREVVQHHATEPVSAAELSELHGIGGSNTVCRWAREAGISPRKNIVSDMSRSKESPGEKKNKRQRPLPG